MMSAPSEMRCREMSVVRMTRKVMASTSGMAMATTSPARQPRLMKEMARTMMTASNNPRVNPDTASSTTAGWSETR